MKVCYLQTIYGDPNVGTTYIDTGGLCRAQYMVGERRMMTVGSDEDLGRQGEVAWNVSLLVVLVGLFDRNIFSDDFSEATDVFMRRGIREEFCWNNE